MDAQAVAGVPETVEAGEVADTADRVASFAVWDQPWWVWLSLALLLCWVWGVNKRIVRLRAAARHAFGLLESQWFMHLAWMEVHASASVLLLDAWARPVNMDLEPFKKALQAAKAKPLDVHARTQCRLDPGSRPDGRRQRDRDPAAGHGRLAATRPSGGGHL